MSHALHPATDPRCPECHGEGYTVGRDGEHARALQCGCTGVCPHCRDTGWVAVSDERRARRTRCACHRLTQRIKAFNEARIPARHSNSTRMSFEPSGPALIGFKAVNAYLERYEPGDENRGMVLHGDVGRGKTHLLVALVRDLIFRHGVTARFVEFSHLVGDLKAGFDIGRGTHSLLDPLVRVDVLAIDELGKGRNTEFEGTVVDELVSRRYNAAQPILATTNYAPGAATGNAVGNLAQPRRTQPVLSRSGGGSGLLPAARDVRLRRVRRGRLARDEARAFLTAPGPPVGPIALGSATPLPQGAPARGLLGPLSDLRSVSARGPCRGVAHRPRRALRGRG